MHDLMKFLHILAVVLLLGNLLMAPFWRKLLAAGGEQARSVANRSMRTADLLFTLPGWVIVLVTGLVLAFQRGWKGNGWIHLSLTLFAGWVILWHMLVLPARKAMIAAADTPALGGQATAALAQHERRWQQWTYVSAAIVTVILLLMVARPFTR